MADKLSETLWTSFTKKQKLDLDDGALVKALAKFDKSDAAKPEPRLDALKEVVEQVKKQTVALTKRKKEIGDKVFGEVKDKLYLVLDLAESLQKETEHAASSSDDEEDTPVLLTTKMIPLLRELRKGEVRMNALVCTAGKNTAVLIMRRAISPSRRKLLAEAVDAKGGAKYIAGECLFENKALTFVVQAAAGGLAKRLREALLNQVQLRLKVRVRGEDGAEDLDGEDESDAGTEAGQAPAGGTAAASTIPEPPSTPPPGGTARPSTIPEPPSTPPPGGAAPASTIPEPPSTPPPGGAATLAGYQRRLDEVQQRLQPALRAQHPEATRLRALLGFAQEKADDKKDYAAALNALDRLDKLLSAPLAGSGGDGAGDGGSKQAMADWQACRTDAVTKLKAVATQIAGARHAASAKAIVEIQAVMKNLTAAPSSRQQVSELQNYIGSDDVVNDVSELADDIRTPLLQALGKLQAAMAE